MTRSAIRSVLLALAALPSVVAAQSSSSTPGRVPVGAQRVIVDSLVQGHVRFGDGDPIAGAAVSGAGFGPVVSAADGSFELPVSLPVTAQWTLSAEAALGAVLWSGSLEVQGVGFGTTPVGQVVLAPEVPVRLFEQMATPIVPGNTSPSDLELAALADLDADGTPDVVCVSELAGKRSLSSLLGAGDGSYELSWFEGFQGSVAGTPRRLRVADADLDGHQDVWVLATQLELRLGDGTGALGPPTLIDTGLGFTADFVLEDVDADGDADLCAIGDSAPSRLVVHLNLGGGSFAPPVEWSVGTSMDVVQGFDLDADGDRDLVVADAPWLRVFVNDGTGAFPTITQNAVCCSTADLDVGDTDGDGDDDVLVRYSTSTKRVSVFTSLGDGTLSAPVNVSTTEKPDGAALADLDGDGRAEILAGYRILVSASLGITLSVHSNAGGPYTLVDAHPLASAATFILPADGDGDGKLDVVVGSESYGFVLALPGQGDGTLAPLGKTAFDPNRWLVGLVVDDFGGEPTDDLLFMRNDDLDVVLSESLGAGLFGPEVEYFGGTGNQMVAGDFDGDGRRDLVFSHAQQTDWTVLYGQPGGGFGSPSVFQSTTVFAFRGAADFDGDGLDDLYGIESGGSDLLFVQLSTGSGFAAPTPVASVPDPADLDVADLDQDGAFDLVIPTFQPVRCVVFLGDGAGGFTRAPDVTLPFKPVDSTLGDLDGDALPDLVVAGLSSEVASLLGAGDGSFQLAHQTVTNAGIQFGFLEDLDKDGHRDLVLHAGQVATVLLGTGDGTLLEPRSYHTASSPGTPPSDLDQDGDLDFAQASRSSPEGSGILILWNRLVP